MSRLAAQQIVSICFYMAGIVGVITAVLTLRANKLNQRENNARRAYLDYTRRAEEKPTFAFPMHLVMDFANQTINESKEEFESYEWYVSSLLTTVLYLTETTGSNSFWKQMMVLQIAYPWRYLEQFRDSKQFLITWNRAVPHLLDEGIRFGKKTYPI